jgi:protein-S-isoprenylcysteine O-methyltransferase Ste14
VVTRREHTLVTSGPYRWVRHPFYAAVALMVLANGLVAANWFLLMTGGLLFGLLAIRSRREEDNLVARFGEQYRDYIRSTGRFLPRL